MIQMEFLLPGLFPQYQAEEEKASELSIFYSLKSQLTDFSLPALETILSYGTLITANKEKAPVHLEQAILNYFKITPYPSELPAGSLSAYTAGLTNDANTYWLRADPVHYISTQRGVTVFGYHFLDLSQSEAESLVKTLNEFLKLDKMELVAVSSTKWCLKLSHPTDIVTNALVDVIGKNIKPYFCSGEDQTKWIKLDVELQMLLANHPINLERMNKGLPVINGVWFWGNGVLPKTVSSELAAIVTNIPLLQALAKLTGVPVHTAFNEILEKKSEKKVLRASFSSYSLLKNGLIEAWKEELSTLEKEEFAPALQALKQGKIKSIAIETGHNRRYELKPIQLNYFWKRKKHFKDFI